MCETFGEQYRDYMRRTGRLFPRIKTQSVTHAEETK
jgi:protein-S-isoprenylcysteine O-methyltransferase Ste14